MAANTTLPGESGISSGHASQASASFPAEVNGTNVNSASSSPEPGASGGEAAEIPTEEADISVSATNSLHASPENRTVATTPAGEAVATLALFYSSPTDPRPTLFSHSELEGTRSVPGASSGVTTSSPLSAATEDWTATPGTGWGPEDLASPGTAVSHGPPLSPSVGEMESSPAAFLSPAASPAEAPVSETESPGQDGASAPESPEPPSESETGRGTSAPAGETSPPAFVAGSLGPAETEGAGLSPSAFPSVTGSHPLASESETVTARAAPEGRGDAGKSVSATKEETPLSVLDTQSRTNPSPSGAAQSPANTEALPAGDPGALSSAETSPRSFPEPGTVTARPTLSGETAPSPGDIPAEPSVSERESPGSSSAGFSGAPGSPQPPPDAAGGTAPVAPGAGEELANSAHASVKGTPRAPSALESAAPAAAAEGPGGATVSGGFASGVAAPSSAELAATEAATTSHAGTRSETDPSPQRAEPSPAPTGELPTGEPGALASPQPSSAGDTALAPALAGNGGATASPVSGVPGETPISNPDLQSATNPAVPERSPGGAPEVPALASADASPPAPLGDGTVPGRLAPARLTSPPAFASLRGAPAEPDTTGDATNGLSGALGAARPAPAREASAANEGTSAPVFGAPGDPASLPAISDSPAGPGAAGSAPPSAAGERVTVPPVAPGGRGDAAGSAAAAKEETTPSNPDAQHAE
ncbi:collagen alpha-1(I) chain-like, partial [Terrapene carolina triunguis]|uniref:collagen alpha-1(I) chain-like n=1 Tax=Terrapene triunguis TaxID=2587831 RepID=UPI001156AC62